MLSMVISGSRFNRKLKLPSIFSPGYVWIVGNAPMEITSDLIDRIHIAIDIHPIQTPHASHNHMDMIPTSSHLTSRTTPLMFPLPDRNLIPRILHHHTMPIHLLPVNTRHRTPSESHNPPRLIPAIHINTNKPQINIPKIPIRPVCPSRIKNRHYSIGQVL